MATIRMLHNEGPEESRKIWAAQTAESLATLDFEPLFFNPFSWSLISSFLSSLRHAHRVEERRSERRKKEDVGRREGTNNEVKYQIGQSVWEWVANHAVEISNWASSIAVVVIAALDWWAFAWRRARRMSFAWQLVKVYGRFVNCVFNAMRSKTKNQKKTGHGPTNNRTRTTGNVSNHLAAFKQKIN